MPLWIPITIAAALCQNIRTTMQQKIRGILSVDGANFVRYLYGAPLALGMLAFLVFVHRPARCRRSRWHFLGLVTIAGVAQIVATSLMIHAFSLRNYAVGTVYSKTETVFVALFATFIAGEPLQARRLDRHPGLPGRRRHPERARQALRRARRAGRPHAQGRAVTASCRARSSPSPPARSARPPSCCPRATSWSRGITVLACMNTIQVVLMALYLSRRDRPQLGKVWFNWRSSIWVGIFSVLGSAGWALAMTLENAALVRAVGQIELVFTFISSRLVLKERPSLGEWIGSILVVGGVVLILATR